MNVARVLTLTAVMPMLLLVSCRSDSSTVTKPRTEAECAGLEERAAGWLEATPTSSEED